MYTCSHKIFQMPSMSKIYCYKNHYLKSLQLKDIDFDHQIEVSNDSMLCYARLKVFRE